MDNYIDLSNRPIVNANKLKLLEIAIDAFSRHGFNGVSIRDMTREAGIKESSFYNHYGSKEELQDTIFANFRISIGHMMPPLHQLDRIVGAMTPEALMRHSYMNLRNHLRSPKMEEIWRILLLEQFRNAAARDIYMNEVMKRSIDFMEAAFAKYAERGSIRPLPPRTLAAGYQYPLFGMVAEFLLHRLDRLSTAAIEERMENHVALYAQLIGLEKKTS
ncbi:transcriptional regulator, TetR family [Paenibacillus sp. UNCCL117]|uniref:TetR/AcrR family transcriptional regulator n=1 Tax=unclassified Paenibacillus TaxID=185978 RepID=UPI0008862433|nr:MULTISPECIES: TetR/AcrR family transcriptional regulator [unclassified Paenibacillus]SDC93704.1 DNA-binding transcriptional regulator, AcrR family [Paenibacillus sp. cl123]SFW29619.1 transcriptional regulator, TetR family [Paenibacillus sp. UNCCL117]